MRVELLYLPIKSDDLVYGTMHQSETVLDHVHVDGCAAIFVSVPQFEQLWVIVNQPRQIAPVETGVVLAQLFLVLVAHKVTVRHLE